jgi:L-amino acid N-acyltransferase YncA
MNVTLREAMPDDLPAILSIVNHAIEHTTAIYDYDPRTLEMQTAWFKKRRLEDFPILVAEHDGTVAGFGSYGTFRERAAYRPTVEHSVYVREDLIGNGIGAKLLTALIELARKNNFHVMIGGIDASNTGSIEFHKKFGFTECGHIREVAYKFDRWLDLVFVQLIL